jgi:hypothetical protein
MLTRQFSFQNQNSLMVTEFRLEPAATFLGKLRFGIANSSATG